MKIIKMTVAIVAALVAQICFEPNASAQPMQGSINQYGWSFTWSVMSTSGLQISSLKHNTVSFMARGSLPALRVQYEQFCGPYLDRIKWDNILPDELGNKVRVTQNGDWLTVWVRAQIASYALTQAWWFHKTLGLMVPEVGSAGLQCENNHRHHPYWRFDFDVMTASNNRIQTFNGGLYKDWLSEFNTTKTFAGNDLFVFRTNDAFPYVDLKPGGNDGLADTFANWDYAGRRYPSNQNDPWGPWSTVSDDLGDLEADSNPNTSNNGEGIFGADVVVWYTGHLYHAASGGPTQWGYVGPQVWTVN